MSTVTVTGYGPQKLPFWSTLGHTYAFWAKNLRDLLRLSWLWFVFTTPLLVLFYWWNLPHSVVLLRGGTRNSTPLLPWISTIFPWLIELPMTASIAVAWHRLVLRGERSATATYLRLDRVVIAYAIPSFVFALILSTASLLYMLHGGGLIASLASCYCIARLIVCLPAKALDRQEITIAKAWRTTRHNGWRLSFGYFLTLLPLTLIEEIERLLWRTPALVTVPIMTAARVGTAAIWVLCLTISVSFLSLAYRHFFEQDPNQPIPASLLSSMIERTMYAALADETRYNLNGVYFEVLPDNADTRRCPQCGTLYQPSEYREDIEHWYCSACDHELPRELQG